MRDRVKFNHDRARQGSISTNKVIRTVLRHLLSTACPDQGFQLSTDRFSCKGGKAMHMSLSPNHLSGSVTDGLVLSITTWSGSQKIYLHGLDPTKVRDLVAYVRAHYPKLKLSFCPPVLVALNQ